MEQIKRIFNAISIHKFESAYDWVEIPEDLPKSNLFLVTAKTASATIHPEDSEGDVVRLFTLKELHEAARSLARRDINLNHHFKIETAFTVDAQYNEDTQAVEALIYVPDRIRDEILSGEIEKPSVEYVWRTIRKTEVGSEFVGLVFDRIALLEKTWLANTGFSAGDRLGEIRKVESTTEDVQPLGPNEKRGYIEPIDKPIEEGRTQQGISEMVAQPEQGFPPKGKLECDFGPTSEGVGATGGWGMKSKDECGACMSDNEKTEAANFVNLHKGEPFAGYKDFDACVAANKDKGNPSAYCGYIKHQVEDKSEATKEAILLLDNPKQPSETNISLGSVNGKDSIGGEPLSPKTENLGAYKDTIPNQNGIIKREQTTNQEKIDVYESQQKPEGTNPLPIASDGPVLNQTYVSTQEPETNVASAGMVYSKAGDNGVYFGAIEKENPHKNLDMPKAPEDTKPNKKEGSSLEDSTPIKGTILTEVIGLDVTKEKVEAAKIEEKKPEPIKEPEKKPETSPIIDMSKFVAKEEFDKHVAHETELESVAKRLTDNAKVSDDDKAKAVKEAYVKGKMEVIGKIKTVIPDDSQFGFNIQNSTRSLITNIKRKCLEMSRDV